VGSLETSAGLFILALWDAQSRPPALAPLAVHVLLTSDCHEGTTLETDPWLPGSEGKADSSLRCAE